MGEHNTTGGSTLKVDNLSVEYGTFKALSDVSLTAGAGKILGVVGESGSGKSTLAKTILGLQPDSAKITAGQILFNDVDLVSASTDEMRGIRGQQITYISQDPLRALTPTLTIGAQMTDIQFRTNRTSSEKRQNAIDMLARVNMPEPKQRMEMYPHQLSGGQRQRVSIAMAVMMKPKLLIADEATTALDATLESEIIILLKELQTEIACSMLFITHHLGVVASLCDDVVVMHNGHVREMGPVSTVFGEPQHAYTKMLLRCDPASIPEKTRHLPTTLDDPDAAIVIETGAPDRVKSELPPLLAISNLVVSFDKKSLLDTILGRSGYSIRAVNGIDLHISQGETLAIVGESGSGKTTIARTIIGLQKALSGSITFEGKELTDRSSNDYRKIRQQIAFMFQDPVGALSPRMKVWKNVIEPLHVHKAPTKSLRSEAQRLLSLVGLGEEFADRYPHELSGGQARRVAVARALACQPELIIADEPTAGLDVSIQGEVLNLLASIQDKTGISMLLITHNLNVVRHISDRVAIMYMGDFLEVDDTEALFRAPKHDYTRKLIEANKHPQFNQQPTTG